MISDERLAAAAEEVSAAMVDAVGLSDHVFSAGFEKKMDALIRRAAHPVRRQVLRYTAAILIAAITAFGSLYLLSPTARAAVNGWVRSTFGGYFHYYSEDNTPPDVEYDYFLPEEFDGYTQIAASDNDFGKSFIYSHSDGRLLLLDYIRSTDSANLFLDVDDCDHSTIKFGTYTADLYISRDPNKNSVIVWEDYATGTIISITATEDKDHLLAIAKKVEKIEKN